jgi:hypothetical protein
MNDEDSIVETIEKEATEAAKAVVADIKAIAAEVADAVAEATSRIPFSGPVPVDSSEETTSRLKNEKD